MREKKKIDIDQLIKDYQAKEVKEVLGIHGITGIASLYALLRAHNVPKKGQPKFRNYEIN